MKKHLHVKTQYGHVLTSNELKAYKIMRKIVKHDAESARGTKDGYSPFADAWNSYFHESDARLLAKVLNDI